MSDDAKPYTLEELPLTEMGHSSVLSPQHKPRLLATVRALDEARARVAYFENSTVDSRLLEAEQRAEKAEARVRELETALRELRDVAIEIHDAEMADGTPARAMFKSFKRDMDRLVFNPLGVVAAALSQPTQPENERKP